MAVLFLAEVERITKAKIWTFHHLVVKFHHLVVKFHHLVVRRHDSMTAIRHDGLTA